MAKRISDFPQLWFLKVGVARCNECELSWSWYEIFCQLREECEEIPRKTIQIDGLRRGGITRVINWSPVPGLSTKYIQIQISFSLSFFLDLFRSKESIICSKILLCCISLHNVLFRPFDEVNEVHDGSCTFVQTCIRCKTGDVWLVLMGARMSLWLAASFLAFSDSWKTSQYITLTPGLPVVSIGRKMRLCMESIRSSTWRMWVLQSRTIWLVQLSGDQCRGLESHAHWFWMFLFVIYQWYSLRMSLVYSMGLRAQRIFLSFFSFYLLDVLNRQGAFSMKRPDKICEDMPDTVRHSYLNDKLEANTFDSRIPKARRKMRKNTQDMLDINGLGAWLTLDDWCGLVIAWILYHEIWRNEQLADVTGTTIAVQHGANIITQISDCTLTWRSWDLHGILQSMLPGMWSPTACLVIVGWRNVADAYTMIYASLCICTQAQLIELGTAHSVR